jgi:class 3 adenylate cyclase
MGASRLLVYGENVLFCSSCGSESSDQARFCAQCGSPLEHGHARREAYTPRHLAEVVRRRRSVLEGERKTVTVLFCDIVDSVELSASVGAERWHFVLEGLFRILSDAVHRFEGTVNQYTGDGIMALFGAPIAHEVHAQRACYAVLHIQDALHGYADELQRELGIDLRTRMGINSGEVIVGVIGDDLRMDYTAQGEIVGLAARLQSSAQFLLRVSFARVVFVFVIPIGSKTLVSKNFDPLIFSIFSSRTPADEYTRLN